MKESNLIQQHEPYNILLIGDACIDEYQYGVVHRISPEAPVPIFNYLYTKSKPGMVLNANENFKAYGVNVDLRCSTNISIKTRLVDLKTKHHLLRVDRDVQCKVPLVANFKDNYDAVVVSDYDKGFITYELLEELPKLFTCPIFIDTKKKNLERIKNCYIKINELEKNTCTTLCDSSRLIITMGGKGAVFKDIMYPAVPVEVTDVCGAGDTFLAALTYFTLLTGSIETAIPFANKASSITVQHFGTYAPSLEEIYEK